MELHPGSEYTPEEIEFLAAVRSYQKKHRRKYPRFTEILEVAKSLGYRRTDDPGASS